MGMRELGYKRENALGSGSVNCKSATKWKGSDRLAENSTARIFREMAEQDDDVQFPRELQDEPGEAQPAAEPPQVGEPQPPNPINPEAPATLEVLLSY